MASMHSGMLALPFLSGRTGVRLSAAWYLLLAPILALGLPQLLWTLLREFCSGAPCDGLAAKCLTAATGITSTHDWLAIALFLAQWAMTLKAAVEALADILGARLTAALATGVQYDDWVDAAVRLNELANAGQQE